MATTTKVWASGTGSVTFSYTGQGNRTITVSSSPNDIYEDRSMTVNISTTLGGNITRQVTVIQGMKEPNLIDSDGKWLIDANDTYLIV